MATKPTPPSQLYSFSDHSINFPTTPQPGDRLDSEFSSLRTFASQVTAWIGTALADDGTIKPGVIGTVTLDPALVQGIVDDVEAAVQPLVTTAEDAAGGAVVARVAAESARDTALGYANAAQGSASAAGVSANAAAVSANTASGDANAASGYAATATSKASEAEDYAVTALDKRNDAIMFAEYMAGPCWTAEDYAVIDPAELPPGFSYQPVEGLPAGLFSAKWWAVQAMQIVENAALDFLPTTGGTMTGYLTLHANPSSSLHAAPKQYVDTKVSINGDTMTGPLILNTSSPGTALQAASKGYVDAAVVDAVGGTYLPLSGGTLTGYLTLYGTPTAAGHAATKGYVDAFVLSGGLDPGVYVISAGDSMDGVLTHTDGTEALPAVSFTADTDTGFYRVGTGSVGLSSNGVQALQASLGILSLPGGANVDSRLSPVVYGASALARFAGYAAAGTRAAPTAVTAKALAVLDGVGWDGSDWKTAARVTLAANQTFGVAANGSYVAVSTTPDGSTTMAERLRVLGSGNVLVASATDLDAAHKLQVNGSVLAQGSSAAIYARATGATGKAVVSAQAGDFASLPSYESANLEYHEASSTVAQCGITLADWGALSFVGTNGGLIYTAASVPLVFGTADAERARIVGAGRVLIGTTTDNATDLVQINGTAAATAPSAGANNTQLPTTAWVRTYASAAYQPLDADLTAIAALAGTSGLLKKTALNTWALDTSSYALASHDHASTYQPLDADLTAIAALGVTKGNLIAGNGSAWAALGVGANNTVLVADSAQAAGVKWTASPEFTDLKISGHAYYDAVYDNGNSGTSKDIDWKNGNKQKVTLTGNCTFTFTNPSGPCEGKLVMIQDSTGGRVVTLPTMKKIDGAAFVYVTSANAINILNWFWDGTNYYGAVASFS